MNTMNEQNKPIMSDHFKSRKPSAIRTAWIEFEKRTDDVKAYNTAIGNVSLPMHPKMIERMNNLNQSETPNFKEGIVKYSSTAGFKETNDALLNIIQSSGFDTSKLYSQITDGGSQSMELMLLGTCGTINNKKRPLLIIDAAYSNYNSLAKRINIPTVSISRTLEDTGKYNLPDISEIEKVIAESNPGAMVVIPYDNPTGHFYDHSAMVKLGKLCVKNNMWLVSDEAYRELFYTDDNVSSIWGLTDSEVPGIEGRRISIETASKVWNACGLRIGGTVTDNKEYLEKSIAENTASLCSNVIGQYIFGALAHESTEDLQMWYGKQRNYYKKMLTDVSTKLKDSLPGVIISSPDAAIYSVVDVKNLVDSDFDAADFVSYCATEGNIDLNGVPSTLLVAPMAGFYNVKQGELNPGKTQMRIAYVLEPEEMEQVPELFKKLFNQYQNK